MDGLRGSEPEVLDRVAAEANAASQDLRSTRLGVDAKLSEVFWEGPDAEAFRGEWHGGMAYRVTQAEECLTEIAADLQRSAAAQREASAR